MAIDNQVKIVKFKCSNCGYEESREYPKKSVPPTQMLCPQCHFLQFNQIKYDFFRDGPKS
jgi:predicted RNA-binding Zn-ribbon protein involved in translation (DUF1610 family)